MKKKLRPVHPGKVLQEEFLSPLGLTQYKLAKATHVPQSRIGNIIAGERGITADTALRLAKFFGTSAEFWMNLQARYDLERTRDESGEQIDSEVEPMPTAA